MHLENVFWEIRTDRFVEGSRDVLRTCEDWPSKTLRACAKRKNAPTWVQFWGHICWAKMSETTRSLATARSMLKIFRFSYAHSPFQNLPLILQFCRLECKPQGMNKHININKFWDCPGIGWVAKEIVFWGHALWGEEAHKQNTQIIPGQFCGYVIYEFFFLLFFRSQKP